MLGVLAIIAVLSVGGIAGYSKAMEKWKTNKAIEQYSYLIYGMLEHLDDLKKSSDDELGEVAKALNLIPDSWQSTGHLSWFADDLGNTIRFYGDSRFNIEIIFSYSKDRSSQQYLSFCRELLNNVVVPLADSLDLAYIWRAQVSAQNEYWYGNKLCGGKRKCLKDITLPDIEQQCRSCKENPSLSCGLLLHFKRSL